MELSKRQVELAIIAIEHYVGCDIEDELREEMVNLMSHLTDESYESTLELARLVYTNALSTESVEIIMELAEVLNNKLQESKEGVLSHYEMLPIFDSKPEYASDVIQNGAIFAQPNHNLICKEYEAGNYYLRSLYWKNNRK